MIPMIKNLGKIFNPQKLIDDVVGGVDKAIFSKEEKADYMKEMLVLYEPYKIAQRIIAILFICVFLLIHLLTAIAHFIYVLNDKSSDSIIELYKYNNDNLGYPVLTIIAFYFAGGVFEGVATKIKMKQDKKKLKE